MGVRGILQEIAWVDLSERTNTRRAYVFVVVDLFHFKNIVVVPNFRMIFYVDGPNQCASPQMTVLYSIAQVSKVMNCRRLAVSLWIFLSSDRTV